ncbi:hypothetical protein VM1G_01255 [Cytospora mali]|uniref:WD repeat-containing protein C3H5.08c n=1 Tax=Cytospora mali TaxID=578113 RepID=A0A194VNM2_CYTMA|nr:hypothetical protein VM1G_01255 [Valsa mali]
MATNSLSVTTSRGQRDAEPSPARSQESRDANSASPRINLNTATSPASANGSTASPSLNTRGSQISTPATVPTPTTSTTIVPPTPVSTNTQLSLKDSYTRLTRRDTPSALKDADDGNAKGPAANTSQPNPSNHSVITPINPGVDPLSQHIFARTNTESSFARQPRIRNTTANRPDSPASGLEPLPRQSSDLNGRQPAPTGDAGKDKKKSGSFLSRFGMRATRKAKAEAESIRDSDSELNGESRMDGTDASVFSSTVEGGGFIPRHKEPPRYIRIRAHNKKHHDREFNRMFLAQELVGTQPKLTEDGKVADGGVAVVTVSVAGTGGRRREKTGGAIWATEFARDGRYLAAAGKDAIVRIWAVISTPEERRAQEEEEASVRPIGERLSAPVFVERPIKEFSGHTNEILDLTWSKNNFLLSTSMDKTVRLWHISRDECLCTFKHKDLVTKVAFHPTDDRFFLAGSLDMTLRLWSIPDKAVAYSVHLPDMVTAVAFTPDGKLAIAGLLNGLCMIYETEGLKFHSQIHAKSSRGKNSKGSKITGIQTIAMPLNSGGSGGTEPGEVKIMVSTNDSRIRVYKLKDGSLDVKFKGHENACTQISGSFSDDAQYIISGSEDRKTFIWKMGALAIGDSNKQPSESFDAHGDIVTTARFAPVKTRQLLSASGDPIYDLCNPPPVTLMPWDEATTASQTALSETGSQEKEQNQDKPPPPTPGLAKKPEYTPAYLARTEHRDGNIIVTSDDQGVIKVFRQDCAFAKRRHESWETGSAFSRKPGGILSSGIGRSSSIRTRTSAGSAAPSRRGSLSGGTAQPGNLPPGVVWGAPGTPKISSDMILSWRQNVEGGGGRPLSIAGSIGAPGRSERSISPAKHTRTPVSGSRANLAADARKQQYASAASSRLGNHGPDSPTGSVASQGRRRPRTATVVEAKKIAPSPLQVTVTEEEQGKEKQSQEKPRPSTSREHSESKTAEEVVPDVPPVPSFSFRGAEDGESVLRLDPAGASYGFWNLNRWKGLASLRGSISEGKSHGGGAGGKGHQRTASDAVASGAESRDNSAGGGSRRKSLVPSRSSTVPTSPPDSEGTLPVPGFDLRRQSNSQRASRLSTVTTHEDHLLAPAVSAISKLSSELTSESDNGSRTTDDGDDDVVPCRKCGATNKFRVKRVQGRQKMVCGRCGCVVPEEKW